MQAKTQPQAQDPYPSSDGQPMAESTDQYDWIVKIKENLERLYRDRDDVFVAGDLFWYPVADAGKTRPTAPDVLVAFGRPKGRRDSYKQWEEGGIAPQVVFEVWSRSNTTADIADKLAFYDRHGAEEFYGYDPRRNRLDIWLRRADPNAPDAPPQFVAQPHVGGWTSPRLGIGFAMGAGGLEVYLPSGEPFLTLAELDRQVAEVKALADRRGALAEQERRRAERLAARLRAAGLDPDADDDEPPTT